MYTRDVIHFDCLGLPQEFTQKRHPELVKNYNVFECLLLEIITIILSGGEFHPSNQRHRVEHVE